MRPRTVLVVDDDASIRLLCRVNLELDGYRVLVAGSLADARTALDAEAVDVVLLDLHVGGLDGRELLEEIRRERAGVGVVLLTGDTSADELRAAGATVVGKPFDLDELREAVERVSSRA